jgi:hypothetical protein
LNLHPTRRRDGMSALTLEANRVHDTGHLGDRNRCEPSTVRDWLRGRSSPTGSRAARLIELGEITDRPHRVMEPDYIPLWLNRPLEVLDDDKPVSGSHAATTAASPSSSQRSSTRSADALTLAVDPVHAGGERVRHATAPGSSEVGASAPQPRIECARPRPLRCSSDPFPAALTVSGGACTWSVNGHRFLPKCGRWLSPRAAIFSPRWWPLVLPILVGCASVVVEPSP